MFRIQSIIFFTLAALLTGCGAYGPKYSSTIKLNEKDAAIYFLRPKNFYHGGVHKIVVINDREKRTLKNNGFFYVIVQPGKHKITVRESYLQSFGAEYLKEKTSPDSIINFEIDLEPGEIKYYG